jgi:hypothetical protein
VLRSLFRFGADPDSPLSPFGKESASIRGRSHQLFKSVIEGGREKVSPDLADALPFCLWLYHMGIVFFWLHDASQDQRKTARLIGLTSGLLIDFILLTSMPILKPFRVELLKLIQEFRLDAAPPVEAI